MLGKKRDREMRNGFPYSYFQCQELNISYQFLSRLRLFCSKISCWGVCVKDQSESVEGVMVQDKLIANVNGCHCPAAGKCILQYKPPSCQLDSSKREQNVEGHFAGLLQRTYNLYWSIPLDRKIEIIDWWSPAISIFLMQPYHYQW
jgi:hypothetical protein